MNIFLKQFLIIIGIISAILGIIFGAILPFQRAKLYIAAIQQSPNIKTLEEFEQIFDKVWQSYSPVGDEEIARHLASSILNPLASPEQPKVAARFLVDYIEPKLAKNNVKHLLIAADMYRVLWDRFGQKEDDFRKSEEYYLKALPLGPGLPLTLYGLLDLYKMKGNTEKMREIGEKILSLWPDDERIKDAIKSAE